jgi:hypothetical protein
MKGDDLLSDFKEIEKEKYTKTLEKLKRMLSNQASYNEKQWQVEILQIMLLLFPKYIRVFSEVKIIDVYSEKDRRLDYLLIDSNGNTDIIEIKRPFDECILSTSTYRDNYIPMRELSGAVMQVEKYIFWLNKWGRQGEKTLSEKYRDYLPDDFLIKIINPNGIIIMGRESNLSSVQKDDFQVIKRKFRNIIDIITYDDLIKRLELLIQKFV